MGNRVYNVHIYFYPANLLLSCVALKFQLDVFISSLFGSSFEREKDTKFEKYFLFFSKSDNVKNTITTSLKDGMRNWLQTREKAFS